MQFRIVSATPGGVYGSSDRLDAQQAVSLFLSMVRTVFPDKVDKSSMTELSLRKYADDFALGDKVLFCGDLKAWQIYLLPVIDDKPIFSEN